LPGRSGADATSTGPRTGRGLIAPSAHRDCRGPRTVFTSCRGALTAYDLPDLVAALPKDKVTIDEPLKLAPADRNK